MKTSVLEGPSDQTQKLSKLHFCYDSKKLAEITYFSLNTGLKFPKLGRNLQRKCVFVQFSQNFYRAVLSLSKIFRSQIFVKMLEVMSTFDIRFENWWFFHKIFGKSG